MKPHERAPFSAIVDRPPLRLPAGLRLVVWPIVNLEVWEIERPMARQVLPAPTGVAVDPDVCNWSWHEYGMRVGVWRFFAALDRDRGAGDAVDQRRRRRPLSPRRRRPRASGSWEFMGHSYVQMPIHQLADQRATIHRALDRLEAFTGRRPVGWLGPGPHRDLRDARPPGRGRRAVYRRLGLGRRARPRSPPRTGRWSRCPTRSSSTTFRWRWCSTIRRTCFSSAPATSSTGFIARARREPRSCPSPSIPTSPACRTGSGISRNSSPMRAATRASRSGPATRCSTGTGSETGLRSLTLSSRTGP